MTSPTPASPLLPVIYATLKKTTARGDLVGCPPVFMPFGAVTSFCGPVVMGKCFEDNSLAKAAVDGSGLLQTPAGLVRAVRVAPRCALPGGNLGARAKAMWRCKFRACGSIPATGCVPMWMASWCCRRRYKSERALFGACAHGCPGTSIAI